MTCDLLDVPQAGIRETLRRAAERFNVIDYMRFDPLHELSPNNIPLLCKTSDRSAPRGAETLTSYSSAELYYNAYDMMTDALIRGYFGESYGIKMGRYLNEIIPQLDALRPCPTFTRSDDRQFLYVAYYITHVVYVLNGCGQHRSAPTMLPQEYAFLKQHLPLLVAADDTESMVEFIDTLKSFGMTNDGPLIRSGMNLILNCQNADGSWGDDDPTDIYPVFHSPDGLCVQCKPAGIFPTRPLCSALQLTFPSTGELQILSCLQARLVRSPIQ